MARLTPFLAACALLAACSSAAPPGGETTGSATQASTAPAGVSSSCTPSTSNLSNVAIKPVMHDVKAHLVFWQPNGAHFTADATASGDARYQAAVESFFRDVQSMPIFGILGQYYDTAGAPKSISFAGSYKFDVGYPTARDGSLARPLVDSDFRDVLDEVLGMTAYGAAPGWTASNDDVFFVFTGASVENCSTTAMSSCTFPTKAADGTTNDNYWAYHDHYAHDSKQVIYAVIPAEVTLGLMDKLGAYPNDKSVDPTILAASHELFEAITDPFGNAWCGPNGCGCDEIGDKCAGKLGPSVNWDGSNVVLPNGHRYMIQQEWSNLPTPDNASGGCALNIAPPPAPSCAYPDFACGTETIMPGYGTPVGYHTVELIRTSCTTPPSELRLRHDDGTWTQLPRYVQFVGDTVQMGPPSEFDIGSQSDTGQTTSGAPVGSYAGVRACAVSAGGTTCETYYHPVYVASCCVPRTCDGVCGKQTDGCGHALDCGPCSQCDPECQCGATPNGVWNGSRCVICTTQKCRCEAGGGTWQGNHCI